ncbi:MAG: helix-turn-helix transcriptional regulator [Prevotella sp.]|nr:helix-turn-helix transcriptional regulator [Prevotella sp.]
MTGNRLKEILYEKKVSQSQVAKLLGVSQQSFNQMLAAADIKSSLLERIAEALGENMSLFYPIEPVNVTISDHGGVSIAGNNTIAGNNNAVGNVTMGDNSAVLQERVTMMEKLLEEKERLIKVLMGK